ncbi:MAG: cytochrome C oxidase subunit IV family protein [Verrucomicrobiota bacterium]|nr:cytochrome C oxidase subunit IV family protein [Verrucomicrobiota bacterium]
MEHQSHTPTHAHDENAPHAEVVQHYTEAEIKHHVKIYMGVFMALLALTLATVTVSYFTFDFSTTVVVALAIASLKAALVAAYFMHLMSEKKLVYLIMLFTVVFFIGLMLLPLLTQSNGVEY